ncbi:hypothetical protein AB0J81_00845 [Streptomyces bobili]|uniref:hypothetical protein n=1 Tax=Streptomyces bobili TaxID=67280 RepID=UPI00343AC368
MTTVTALRPCVAVLGAVPASRFAAESQRSKAPAAGSGAERCRVVDSFAAGPASGQLVGAAAVLLGGLVVAVLLRRVARKGHGGPGRLSRPSALPRALEASAAA